jgi:putative ABC transport system substrate-binding protein
MQRRDFIAGLGGAAAWPLVGRAQQAGSPVIGFLSLLSAETSKTRIAAFLSGLAESGFAVNRNVEIEYRFANGEASNVPALAAELVDRRVSVIATGYQTLRAARAATATIPIIFMGGADPVRAGLVASINRPVGNITGASIAATGLTGKRIGLLHELVPQSSILGTVVDALDQESLLEQVKEAAHRLGLMVVAASVRSERDFEDAFVKLARDGAGAIIVVLSAMFNTKVDLLVAAATRQAIPTMYELREFVEAGGLMSYAPSITDAYRQGGAYTGRVLKGEKPAEMPIVLPVRFELTLNLKTAKSLGLTIPLGILAIADQVIE